MKLAAIWNVWDGDELLPGSINQIIDHVDQIILVWQEVSNFGEWYQPEVFFDHPKITRIKYVPNNNGGKVNEVNKRNIGIQAAKEMDCTHFLHLDCDEYYQDFGSAKEMYINSGCDGSVCKLLTYFQKPTLRLENPEGYYVPFIHKIHPHTQAGVHSYPFYVDPTRRINTSDVVELPIFMHHYSWVRKDIGRKIRNSTARKNLEKSCVMKDYSRDLKGGDYVEYYKQKLIEVPNYFNISI